RAHQVPDVLHEHHRTGGWLQFLQTAAHHGRVEVAAGAGVELHGGTPRRAQPGSVEIRLLVPFDNADRGTGEVAQGPLQQRRLARPRRAHQVDGDHSAFPQPGPIALGQLVVLGQHPLLERDHPGRAGLLGVLRATAGTAHPHTISTALIRSSCPESTATSALPQEHRTMKPSISNSAPQLRQRPRPLGSVISRSAPCNRESAATISKQNRTASGTTPESFPISRWTPLISPSGTACSTASTMLWVTLSSCISRFAATGRRRGRQRCAFPRKRFAPGPFPAARWLSAR